MKSKMKFHSSYRFIPSVNLKEILSIIMRDNSNLDDVFMARQIESRNRKDAALLIRDNISEKESYFEITPEGEILVFEEEGEEIIYELLSEKYRFLERIICKS